MLAILWIWMVFFLVSLLSTVRSYHLGLTEIANSAHDGAALFVCALFSIALVNFLKSDEIVLRFVAMFSVVSAAAIGVLLVLAATRSELAGINPWYAAIRFTGWSVNPNQLGLFLVAIPYLWAWNRLERRRPLLSVGMILIIVAGIATQSDALFVSWLCGTLFVLTMGWCQALALPDRSLPKSIFRLVLLPAMAISFVGVLFWVFAEGAAELLIGRYELGGQGSTRFEIWANALAAIADSPVIGNGVGAFAGVWAPFSGYEAHNTYLDLGTKAGLFVTFAYSVFSIGLILRLVMQREVLMAGAFTSLVVFSVFHYVLRQPVYWMTVVICLQIACRPDELRKARVESASKVHVPMYLLKAVRD